MDNKILVGAGIAALAITSGNQARRHQRQNMLKNPSEHVKHKKEVLPLMPIQSSEMYHNDTAQLAASISSYRYGAKLPGYMT